MEGGGFGVFGGGEGGDCVEVDGGGDYLDGGGGGGSGSGEGGRFRGGGGWNWVVIGVGMRGFLCWRR